jgi:4-hydroxy-tetrahydrodipicolinate reductase
MDNVKVAIWGFGAMGQGIARVLLGKTGVEISGICCRNKGRQGKTMYEILGLHSEQKDVPIINDIEQVVAHKGCDVVMLCTDSFTQTAAPKIELLVGKGVNVITLAEERAWPWAQQPELAARIDEAARAGGVSVLGTGINPGMVMDLLAVVLSAAMVDVKGVKCERVNSLSPFGRTVMEEQGVGLAPEEFADKQAKGQVSGHVGFAESIAMIAEGIGLEYNEFKQQMQPIITAVDRKSPHGFAAAGHLAGVNMTAQALKDGQTVIDMYHPQQIEPHLAGVATGDYITLTGSPPIAMAINPEIEGGLGTIAMAINCIPHVINAAPGLISMLDIPIPRAIMGDFRKLIKK